MIGFYLTTLATLAVLFASLTVMVADVLTADLERPRKTALLPRDGAGSLTPTA